MSEFPVSGPLRRRLREEIAKTNLFHVAVKCGVDRNSLVRLLKHGGGINVKLADRICRVYGMSLEDNAPQE